MAVGVAIEIEADLRRFVQKFLQGGSPNQVAARLVLREKRVMVEADHKIFRRKKGEDFGGVTLKFFRKESLR